MLYLAKPSCFVVVSRSARKNKLFQIPLSATTIISVGFSVFVQSADSKSQKFSSPPLRNRNWPDRILSGQVLSLRRGGHVSFWFVQVPLPFKTSTQLPAREISVREFDLVLRGAASLVIEGKKKRRYSIRSKQWYVFGKRSYFIDWNSLRNFSVLFFDERKLRKVIFVAFENQV